MKKFINKFQSLTSSTFISINNYLAKTSGEVANHVINVNISVLNAKKTDFELLKSCNTDTLKTISAKSFIALDTVKLALTELLASSEKNLNPDKAKRTAQSQAQTDSFIFLTPAIRLHKETMQVHVFGQAINKTVLVKGEYKTVNSSDKTIANAKKLIKKELNLRTDKFRDFILGNVDNMKVSGDVIVII